MSTSQPIPTVDTGVQAANDNQPDKTNIAMTRFQGGNVKLDDESIYSRWLSDSIVKPAGVSIYTRWMCDGCGR